MRVETATRALTVAVVAEDAPAAEAAVVLAAVAVDPVAIAAHLAVNTSRPEFRDLTHVRPS